MHVCTALGACFGGTIGSLVGTEWASPAAAFGAAMGRKTGGTVR